MNAKIAVTWLCLLFLIVGAGCARDSALTKHDRVLTYPLSMDITFLRTLEAVEAMEDWELGITDKEKGFITVVNHRYSSFADADLRKAVLILKRKGFRETTIQLDPESQAVVDGDKILNIIDEYLTNELNRYKF